MIAQNYMPLLEIAEICRMEPAFLKELACCGIIEIHIRENTECLEAGAVALLRMVRRLHADLGVNREGIEVILSMRSQILALQEEVVMLRRKVSKLSAEQKYRNLDLLIEEGLLIEL